MRAPCSSGTMHICPAGSREVGLRPRGRGKRQSPAVYTSPCDVKSASALRVLTRDLGVPLWVVWLFGALEGCEGAACQARKDACCEDEVWGADASAGEGGDGDVDENEDQLSMWNTPAPGACSGIAIVWPADVLPKCERRGPGGECGSSEGEVPSLDGNRSMPARCSTA